MAWLAASSNLYGAEGARVKRVLIVSTGSSFAPGFRLAEQTAVDTLRRLESGPMEFYSESLDIVRFPSDSYSRLFRNYLGEKYVDYPPDLVLLIYVGNLGLAEKLLKELFPGVPIVVIGLTEEKISPAQLGIHLTGLAQRSDPRGTIELVLRLQPETRRIVVIGGTAEVDTHVVSRVREAARSLTGRAEFDFWTNRSMSEMTQAVRSLPPQTAILFTRMFRDGAGQAFNSAQAVKLIAESANVPVYIMTGTLLGSGAVGGTVADVAALAQRAGELAHRVLNGAAPKSLPFEIRTDGVPMFDWQALKRWGISESHLPPGSIVRNRPRSIWAQYQWYIIGALVIMAIQAAMIADLLLHRARRRRAEAELWESRQFMELATDAGEIGLWVRDMVRDELWATPRLRALFGFGPKDVLSIKEFQARIHPDDRHRITTAMEHARDAEIPFEVEFRTALPLVAERWVATKGRFVRDPQGQAVRTMGTIIDVTERKRAEERLRKSEEWLRLAAEGSHLGVWYWDEMTKELSWDGPTHEMFGVPADTEITLQTFYKALHPDDVERVRQTWRDALDSRQPYQIELRVQRTDSSICWIHARGRGYYDETGNPTRMIGVVLDITERKKSESELQLQRQELAHITRVATMGELATSLAHELNQPLTAILSNSQAAQRFLAADPADLEEVREILTDLVKDTGRASDVIRRMRTLVKKEQLEFTSLDLGNVIGEVVLLAHSDAILHNIRVLQEIDPRLPPSWGDRVQLQQVLLNLLLNAFDAMADCPPREREIHVRAVRDGGQMVEITVSDHGTGLTVDELEKVFQPFYTTKHDGLGMGLSITRSIIEAHGGRLWAENNPDRGATFYFTLPIASSTDHGLTPLAEL